MQAPFISRCFFPAPVVSLSAGSSLCTRWCQLKTVLPRPLCVYNCQLASVPLSSPLYFTVLVLDFLCPDHRAHCPSTCCRALTSSAPSFLTYNGLTLVPDMQPRATVADAARLLGAADQHVVVLGFPDSSELDLTYRADSEPARLKTRIAAA